MAEERRALIVQAAELVYTGQGVNGEYSIYKITATKEDGSPVTQDLRSFSDLAEHHGKPVMYEVERYENTRGVSFTLKPPRKPGGGSGGKVTPRVEALENAVRALTTRVNLLEGGEGNHDAPQAERPASEVPVA